MCGSYSRIRSSHCFALFLGGAGVNDHGALGMDTGGLVDMKDGDDDSDSESGLNPKESTPTEVDTTEIPSCRQVTMQV